MAKRVLIVHGGWDGHQPRQVADIFAQVLADDGFDIDQADTLDAFADAKRMAGLALIVPVWTMGKITDAQLKPVLRAVADEGVGLAGCHGGMNDAFRDSPDWQFMTGGQWVAHPGDDGVPYRVTLTPPDPLSQRSEKPPSAPAGATRKRAPGDTSNHTVESDASDVSNSTNPNPSEAPAPGPARAPDAADRDDPDPDPDPAGITQGIADFDVTSEQYYLHLDPAVRVLATCRFPVAPGPHAPNGPVDMPVLYTKRYGQGRVFYNALGHNAAVIATEPCLTLTRRGFRWAAKG